MRLKRDLYRFYVDENSFSLLRKCQQENKSGFMLITFWHVSSLLALLMKDYLAIAFILYLPLLYFGHPDVCTRMIRDSSVPNRKPRDIRSWKRLLWPCSAMKYAFHCILSSRKRTCPVFEFSFFLQRSPKEVSLFPLSGCLLDNETAPERQSSFFYCQ